MDVICYEKESFILRILVMMMLRGFSSSSKSYLG